MTDAAVRPQRARRSLSADATPPPGFEAPSLPEPAPVVAVPAPVVNGNGHALEDRPLGWVRKPFGAYSKRLQDIPREGYHRRWINDDKGRVNRALEAGYAHVKDKDGKPMVHHAGTLAEGGGMKAYYMEIPLDWYREDQAVKDSRRDEIDKKLRRGEVEGRVIGKDGAYQPTNAAGGAGLTTK